MLRFRVALAVVATILLTSDVLLPQQQHGQGISSFAPTFPFPIQGALAVSNSCSLTGIDPRRYHVSMCTGPSRTAGCCLPGVDAGIRDTLVEIANNGVPECRLASNHIIALVSEIQAWLCMPCSHNEPAYRFLLQDGDVHVGGLAPPNPDAEEGAHGWRVCRSFLYGPAPHESQGMWGGDGKKYDDCGLNLPSCNQASLVTFDTTSGNWTTEPSGDCDGFEFIIPSVEFANSAKPAEQLLLRLPSVLNDFTIFVVDETDPSYDPHNAPCLGSINGLSSYVGLSTPFMAIALVFTFLTFSGH